MSEIAHHLPVVASVAAVIAGPLLLWAVGPLKRVGEGVRWLLVLAVGLLVAVLVLPECIREAGLWAAGSLVVGVLLPSLSHRAFEHGALRYGRVLLVVPLILHALLDGVALHVGSEHASHAGHGLVAALVLHRLPEGIGIWCLARRYGRRTRVACLALDALCCVVGFYMVALPSHDASPVFFAMLEAFVGGILLHVLLEKPSASGAHAH